MPTSNRYNEQLGAIETVYTGTVAAADLIATTSAAVALGAKHGCCRYFTDCSGLREGHSLFDLYEAVSQVLTQLPPTPLKEAVVMSPGCGFEDKFHFWETMCRNRGLNIRIFTDRAAALQWLAQ